MNRDTTATLLRRTRHKHKQVREALKLVEDLGWRIGWAMDFSEHQDINDILDPISNILSDAENELEELEQQLHNELDEYRTRVNEARAEIARETLTIN